MVLEIVGVALASASAGEQFVTLGRRIYKRIKHEKKLKAIARQLQVFEVEDRRGALLAWIELAKDVLKSSVVKEEHKRRLESQWNRLNERLIEVDRLYDEIILNSSILNTVARHEARDQLAALGGDNMLSGMLERFRDTVIAVREVKRSYSPLFLAGNDFTVIEPETRCPMPEPGTFLSKGRLTNPQAGLPSGVQWFLYESKPYVASNKEDVRENIRILAEKVHDAQPKAGILKLAGFRDDCQPGVSSFQLLFTGAFGGTAPPTLLTYMSDHPAMPSLNFRVSLCYQLARAVIQTHVLRLVHKNIRPENIIFLQPAGALGDLLDNQETPDLFLSGWQYARHIDYSVTNLRNEVTLQKKIYQHPERQLPTSEKEYSMGHDVYSLGVCMLEILTWESLLKTRDPPAVSDAFIDAFNLLELDEGDICPTEPYTRYPDQIKAALVKLTDIRIPAVAGVKMAQLIRGFLECLDEHDDDSSAEPVVLNNKDSKEAALHFVDTAASTINSISSCL
ncbi:het-s domain protein [Arthroderma uncinatum]|uniref:het-s domain protein n=1 Tax=Arthroderma uncinatum TaxID=74035 RepID=UPI00144AA38C|nr:het-s domain protein [Arthroderma uncinatum]KAF3481764.1 het-s domain protein [Arthroderma uncinatum]